MTIYIDTDFKCHVEQPGDLMPIETDFFDGKCREYIEGYRYVPASEIWTRDDGIGFAGEMVAPWKDIQELETIQRAYEHARYEAAIAAVDTVLLQMGGAV